MAYLGVGPGAGAGVAGGEVCEASAVGKPASNFAVFAGVSSSKKRESCLFSAAVLRRAASTLRSTPVAAWPWPASLAPPGFALGDDLSLKQSLLLFEPLQL